MRAFCLAPPRSGSAACLLNVMMRLHPSRSAVWITRQSAKSALFDSNKCSACHTDSAFCTTSCLMPNKRRRISIAMRLMKIQYWHGLQCTLAEKVSRILDLHSFYPGKQEHAQATFSCRQRVLCSRLLPRRSPAIWRAARVGQVADQILRRYASRAGTSASVNGRSWTGGTTPGCVVSKGAAGA